MKTTSLHFGPGTDDAYAETIQDLRIEKVIIVGAKDEWVKKKTVMVHVGEEKWEAEVDGVKGQKGKPNVVIVRDPKLPVARDWVVRFDAEQERAKGTGHTEL